MVVLSCIWRASELSETLSGVYKFELMRYVYIYMYGGTCAIIVAHATKHNVGGVRPQPFFVCASRFKRSNQWKRHEH